MSKVVISEELQTELKSFLQTYPAAELINTYLFFIEKYYRINPVLFTRDKVIYQSEEEAINALEKEHKLWHETQIKISLGQSNINDQTKKIYICPFSGKVFGDNTHPNPQDAIYDWVAKCPENTERVGGLKSKRFFVSEDPEVIQNYVAKIKPKTAISKTVFSSVLNGRLYNTKQAVINDFKKNYLKDLSLLEVQNQNRFQIEEHFLNFIQKQLVEDKITAFVEALSEIASFETYVNQWIEAE